MKRLICIVMVLSLIFGTSVSNAADSEPTIQELSHRLASEITSFKNRAELYDFLVLYRSASDKNLFFDAYWSTFVRFSGDYGYNSQKVDDLEPLMKSFLPGMIGSKSLAELRNYLGINSDGSQNDSPDVDALESYLVEVLGPIRYLLRTGGYDISSIPAGIDLLEKSLDFIERVLGEDGSELDGTYGYSKALFICNEHNDSTLELDKREAEELVDYLNGLTAKPIFTDVDDALVQMSKVVVYYNGQDASDQARIFEFLSKYGFLKLVNSVDKPAVIITKTETVIVNDQGKEFTIPTQLIPLAGFGIFDDMDDCLWALEAVDRLFQFGIINGKVQAGYDSDTSTVDYIDDNGEIAERVYNTRSFNGESGLFKPYDLVTRAEFAAIVVRLMGIDVEDIPSVYTDVAEDVWYKNEVMAAHNSGYMTGDDKLFEPERMITRGEVAMIIGHIMSDNGIETQQSDLNRVLTKFSDQDLIDEDDQKYVELTVSNNILTATGTEGVFYLKPGDRIIRAEMAEMLYDMAKIVDTQVYINPEFSDYDNN